MVSKTDGCLARYYRNFEFFSDLCAPCADKPFQAEWVDLVRFNSEGKITQMKEFFDSGGTHGHLEEHEGTIKDVK